MNLRPLLQGWRDWLLLAMCGMWLAVVGWIGLSAKQISVITSEVGAAWVQAIGSVVAILAAGLVAWSEHHRANRTAIQAEIDLIDTLGTIALAAEERFNQAARHAEVLASFGTSPKEIAESLERYGMTARVVIDRVLQGRLARAEILLAAADLNSALDFEARASMLTNATLVQLECSKRAGLYASLAERLRALRPTR